MVVSGSHGGRSAAEFVIALSQKPSCVFFNDAGGGKEDAGKVALPFDEGHYLQVEVAGKLAGSDQPVLADQFLNFMLSRAFQEVIPTTNWMYPATALELPKGFETLIQPTKTLLLSAEAAQAARESALEEWRAALSR